MSKPALLNIYLVIFPLKMNNVLKSTLMLDICNGRNGRK